MFTAMTANQTLEAAKKLPNPRKLWKEFWYENEVCCLFADTNVGKSDAMDVDSDIRVMETMLRRDGASVEDDFGLNGGTAVQEWEQE